MNPGQTDPVAWVRGGAGSESKLQAAFHDPGVRAVVFDVRTTGEIPSAGLAGLRAMLAAAPVPVLLMASSTHPLAGDCPFRQDGNPDDARRRLSDLVERRSRAQVEAVVESVRNARSLPIEAALDREVELFCALAVCAKPT